MGNADLKGTFAGELEVECSMGNLKFTLEGAEQDYNYDIEAAMSSFASAAVSDPVEIMPAPMVSSIGA